VVVRAGRREESQEQELDFDQGSENSQKIASEVGKRDVPEAAEALDLEEFVQDDGPPMVYSAVTPPVNDRGRTG
jgi:hypothetical protein